MFVTTGTFCGYPNHPWEPSDCIMHGTPPVVWGESLVNEAQRGFSFRVLVVDDDESVRDVSKLVLASQGYEVITAENGFDASSSQPRRRRRLYGYSRVITLTSLLPIICCRVQPGTI